MRKPHNGTAGYVAELRSYHPQLHGHFVMYDRDASPSPGIDADERWIVMFEATGGANDPNHSAHVALSSKAKARELMKAMASGGNVADFGQAVC